MKESSEQGCGAETHSSQQSRMVGCGPWAGAVAEAVLQTGCGLRAQLPVPRAKPALRSLRRSSGATGHLRITGAAQLLVPRHAHRPSSSGLEEGRESCAVGTSGKASLLMKGKLSLPRLPARELGVSTTRRAASGRRPPECKGGVQGANRDTGLLPRPGSTHLPASRSGC